MKRLIGAFVLTLGLSAGPVLADDCTHPGDAPSVPNGAEASQSEMIAAATAVKQFNADTTAYLECMDAKDADMAALQSQYEKQKNKEEAKKVVANRKERLEKRNAAFESLDKTANEFNEAVRDYKAKASAESGE